MSIAALHPIIQRWFLQRFGTPTEAQALGWAEITKRNDTLIMAPTGSGKTLAAFLVGIDALVRDAIEGRLQDQTRVIYISPLKALGADVDRNLETPLRQIEHCAAEMGRLLPPIRSAVRSGDTTQSERAKIIRRPPHLLITTPESLYLMLTSEGGRRVLQTADTIIVDEIHALYGQKRGAHLALSLERLDVLCRRRLLRIGLSATAEPVARVAHFLVGSDGEKPRPCARIDAGRVKPLDVAIEIPQETLSAIASRAAWNDVYKRIGELLSEHQTTLIFVPSRRLSERVAHDLEALLGKDQVAAHHGALSKRTRLLVERKLQNAELRAVVATASLELGIDIGGVELVCQIGSPRSIAVLRQRIGRAAHSVGGTPKGRIFAMTRDELVECAAGVRALRKGLIDEAIDRPAPLDVLAQQVVATCSTGVWQEQELFELCRRAAPYADLPRPEFDQVVTMLSDGVSTRRGRSGAHLHFDRVHHRLRDRRGAKLAAITSGGTIPEKADYLVIEEPAELVVGTIDEDFAIESMAGDVFLLGSTPWRVLRVENGRVRVAPAPGMAPSVPFWNGEGLSRTVELSQEVANLREAILARPEREEAVRWLSDNCALSRHAAEQAHQYIIEGAQALGAVPTQTRIIAERFFDEAGGMQLILHAPFGARINKAWGLGLRKKFCRSFDFELQAAATDDAILLSLGPQHSFPLDAIFGFLAPATLRDTLLQSVLRTPIWETRWRWTAMRSLAILRHQRGRKTPPPILRMRAADLSAAIFPALAGCQDNHGGGDLEIPDHPLATETARDCLQEAMDADGLWRALTAISDGKIECLSRDTVAPSPFAAAILNSAPYTFLDDAPLEERRARQVATSRAGEARPQDLTRLDDEAIRQVVAELDPLVRDSDELHDHLYTMGLAAARRPWRGFFDELVQSGRATTATISGRDFWVAAERLPLIRAAFEEIRFSAAFEFDAPDWDRPSAIQFILAAKLRASGPTTTQALATELALPPGAVDEAIAALEADGQVLQGHFSPGQNQLQWCERGILQRIHRRTLQGLRAQVSPVSPAELMRFLFRWQHVAPGTRLHGADGLLQVIAQLEGFELSPQAWERDILPRRIENYSAAYLDELCFSGEVAWGRLAATPPEPGESRRARSSGAVSLFLRAHANFLIKPHPQGRLFWQDAEHLSPLGKQIASYLEKQGAAFTHDLLNAFSRPKFEVESALWELVRMGAVASDGFSGLRLLLQRGRPTEFARHRAGRWSLLARATTAAAGQFFDGSPVEEADLYLRRYGVVCRALLTRENGSSWRDLVAVYRRLEARGEIRGGRFVGGLTGEQFALPEAAESLVALRRQSPPQEEIMIAATDPLNLVGILSPGPRAPAYSGHTVRYHGGVPVTEIRNLVDAIASGSSSTLSSMKWPLSQAQ